MSTQNKILNDNEAQNLIDALKPVTKAEQKKLDAAKRAVEKARLSKEKAAKAAREKAAKEKELADKKNQAKLDREAALKRADEERARQQKELEEFQAAQSARLAAINANESASEQRISDKVERDEVGITGQGIVNTLNDAEAGFAVLWREIGALPLDAAIDRLNFAHQNLSDVKKETLYKGVQNRCSPSNADKNRDVWLDKLGKIGRKSGVYQLITQAESDQKAAAARAAAEKRAEEKRLEDERKARENSLKSGPEPKEPTVDENKPDAKLDTNLSPDKENLPSGTADRKRNIANLIVSIIDTYSLEEIEEIIMQLDEHVTKNRIVLKSVSNG